MSDADDGRGRATMTYGELREVFGSAGRMAKLAKEMQAEHRKLEQSLMWALVQIKDRWPPNTEGAPSVDEFVPEPIRRELTVELDLKGLNAAVMREVSQGIAEAAAQAASKAALKRESPNVLGNTAAYDAGAKVFKQTKGATPRLKAVVRLHKENSRKVAGETE